MCPVLGYSARPRPAARGFRGRRLGHDDAQRIPRWRPKNNNKHSFPYEPLVVLAHERDDGLGILLLDSNADTHFSFTNALGLITTDQVRALESACAQSRGRAGSSRCVWRCPSRYKVPNVIHEKGVRNKKQLQIETLVESGRPIPRVNTTQRSIRPACIGVSTRVETNILPPYRITHLELFALCERITSLKGRNPIGPAGHCSPMQKARSSRRSSRTLLYVEKSHSLKSKCCSGWGLSVRP